MTEPSPSPSVDRDPDRTTRTPPRLLSLVIIAGTAVVAMNIFLPMLPQIADGLGTTQATAQYVLTLFLAATGFAQLFIGPISDRYGRRPVLLASTLVFLLGTLICIFAPTIEILLIGRVIQASSAANIALSRAIVRDMYDRNKAASMIGYVTMAMAVLPMVSPAMGGLLGEYYGWRSSFVALFVIGLGVLALIYFDVGEIHKPVHNSISDQFSDYLRLLREPAIWGYTSAAAFGSGAYFAFLGGAPFVGTEIVGMTPTDLGTHFALVAVGYMIGNFLSGRFSERVGLEQMMVLGSIVACVGVSLAWVLMNGDNPMGIYLFGPMALVGAGNGLLLPNANAGIVSVRPELAGSASGIAGFLQIGGGAALASLSGALISVENGAFPLYAIMFLSSLIGGISALMVYLGRKPATD